MAGLRVIAGEAKGRRLKMVPGGSARPISDRAKEALFNILGAEIRESVFLDLFAGTGSVGIEALSRGAARAVFVEKDSKAVKVVEENLALTGLGPKAEVIHEDAFRFLQRMPRSVFDFVYVAPPQYQGLWEKAVLALDRSPYLLRPDAAVIAQLDPQEFLALELSSLVEYDRRKYGSTLLVFLEYIPGRTDEVSEA